MKEKEEDEERNENICPQTNREQRTIREQTKSNSKTEATLILCGLSGERANIKIKTSGRGWILGLLWYQKKCYTQINTHIDRQRNQLSLTNIIISRERKLFNPCHLKMPFSAILKLILNMLLFLFFKECRHIYLDKKFKLFQPKFSQKEVSWNFL